MSMYCAICCKELSVSTGLKWVGFEMVCEDCYEKNMDECIQAQDDFIDKHRY